MFRVACIGMSLAVGWWATSTIHAQEVNSLLVRIKAVGKEGTGNVEARKAWKELVQHGPTVLPDVLAGLDDATPTAANWLRGAVEAIADKAVTKGQKFPTDRLESFLTDTHHAGHARRLAFDLLTKLDPTTPDRHLPKMLNDPGQELRRDAVARFLAKAEKVTDPAQAKTEFQDALKAARDRDQVKLIAQKLKKLGVDIDLTKHFGFVTNWAVVGPFENSKGVGFSTTYPPERGVDLQAEYVGKKEEKIRWQRHTTDQPFGMVDLNKIFGNLKGAVAFAYSEITSPNERPVEIRVGSNNAVRIYLNGKEVYFREEYHHGLEMDQHVGKGTLVAGRNEILIKVCQNEQTDSWAQLWSFQLRVSDALGGSVPVTVVTKSDR